MNTVPTTMNEEQQTPAQKLAESARPTRPKIKLPAYQGLRPASRERHKVLPSWAIATLILIGFLAAAAFVADVFVIAKKTATVAPPDRTAGDMLLAITTSTNRYVDAQGRFSIVVPNGWSASAGDTNVQYDVKLSGPGLFFLEVMVGDAPGDTIEGLKKTFASVELDTMRNTHIEDMTFHGQPAISRYCRMDINALRAIDFLDAGRSFHLMATIPREKFESHRAVLDALMETIEPGKPH